MPSKGYSLLELMVVVAIVGIIAAIAYPSYQGYLRDTYQAQALADLQICSSRLERFYSNNNFSYLGADAGDVCVEWSPSDQPAANAQFTMSYETEARNRYTIRMTPTGDGCWVEMSSDGSTDSETGC